MYIVCRNILSTACTHDLFLVYLYAFRYSISKELALIVSIVVICYLLQIFLWQEQIEHYCKEEDYGYAVVGKDGTNNLGEDVEHACGLGETKTYAERKTHDDHIALRESATSHHAEACIENAAKHHYGASSKYSLRNRR